MRRSERVSGDTSAPNHDVAATRPPTGPLSPLEAGEKVADDDLIAMQARSHIRAIPDHLLNKLPTDALKRVVDSDVFESACNMANDDPAAAAARLASLAKDGGLAAIVEFASILLSGPVGRVGSRRSLRAAAILLLDKVLGDDPDCCAALCVKGEALLPQMHLGKADPETPMFVLNEAYALFCKASNLGSRDGRFLKGRWLVTMAPIHKSAAKVAEGKALVQEAVDAGVARALVFLAQCYEFPGRFSPHSFARDLPSSRAAKEKVILDLYVRAAELGDANALNDVGSSYATGYGGLKHDFDVVTRYYVRAIQAGSLHAFDNLGTHFETGMSGRYPERIDLHKAVHYYRQGARMRCSKCSHNLAQAYDEGMGDVVPRDPIRAEKYYRYTILLADDDNDAQTASRALKELVGVYITRLKCNRPDGDCVKHTLLKLHKWLSKRMLAGTLHDVNRAILHAVKDKPKTLIEFVGEHNALAIVDEADSLLSDIRDTHTSSSPNLGQHARLKHLFGSFAPDAVKICARARSKRRRISE